MPARDLTFLAAGELIKLYRTRRVSPLEVMQALLARIDAVNPRVNAIVTLARDAALWNARRATATLKRGATLPPLFGVPVTIKDVTPTAGIRTTQGSKLFEDHVPVEDALVVQRLKAAGAIVLGKTNTPEFAFGPNTVNALFGATRNPWDLSRTAGGSSGGAAAALATGMCPLAEGTDLGGSLRGPASFCGVIGFRTTPGLIPRYPSALAWDSYSVEGPMARTVSDTALMLSVMAGPDDRAPLSYDVDTRQLVAATRAPSVKGWRVAWTIDLGGLVLVDDEVRAIVEHAVAVFRGLGARVEAACPDMSDVPEIVRLTRGQLMVARHADKLAEHRAILQAGLVENTEAGLAQTPREIAEGELLRTRQWQRVREFLEPRDVWLTPTMAVPPFPVEHPHILEVNGKPVGRAMQRSHLTYAFSVLGLPAISIPCGFTRAGLPVGLQIVGKRRGEAAVLRAAAAFELAQPWADRRPPVLGAPTAG
ncbi:MAG TPA: amidase family protein [Methylomirabilota bacterium]|jgi:amidase|nr:amidase family protein [Methylomirabilota bacterium]